MPNYKHAQTGQEITVSGAVVESAYEADPAWRRVEETAYPKRGRAPRTQQPELSPAE
jgi:hypothetical protein